MYYPVEVKYMSAQPVTDISRVAEARRAATELAGSASARLGSATSPSSSPKLRRILSSTPLRAKYSCTRCGLVNLVKSVG